MILLQTIHQFDVTTFHWFLKRKRRDLAVNISRKVSLTADGPAYVLIGLMALAAGDRLFATLLVLGFAVERAIYFVFKSGFKRNRPPQAIPGFESVIQPSDQFSFPSGHTSAAFFMATALTLYMPALAVVLVPWAMLVGLARVVLGVHFPTDIVAGAVIGTSVCLWTSSFLAI